MPVTLQSKIKISLFVFHTFALGHGDEVRVAQTRLANTAKANVVLAAVLTQLVDGIWKSDRVVGKVHKGRRALETQQKKGGHMDSEIKTGNQKAKDTKSDGKQ